MSEERAGRLRTRIASGRLSSECTTGLAVRQEDPLELELLLEDELDPHPPPTPALLTVTAVPLGFEELLVTVTELTVRLLRPSAIAQLPEDWTGLDACEWDEECDEEEELCELL